MGRTLPTFNTYLQEEIDSWRPFRRALRAGQKEAFDHLFTRVRAHTAEATAAARPVPFDAFVMAILLEQELEIGRLKQAVEALLAVQPKALPAGVETGATGTGEGPPDAVAAAPGGMIGNDCSP